MTGRKLLITGGSGFIGTVAVDLALEAGFDVRNIDFKEPRRVEHLPLWRRVDVRDRDAVFAEVASFAPEYILHLASDIDVTLTKLSDYRTTIEGTRNVIDAAERLPSLRRFVHTSTQYVVKPGVEPREERYWVPYTLYGEAKAETEKLVWASKLTDWYIVRPTIIWGPHHPSFADLIWKYIAERKYLHPASRHPIMRSYGYVTNVASQMVAFLERGSQPSYRRVFYLGDAVMNYDTWVDAFSLPLTGRPARRIPMGMLKVLGLTGEVIKTVGIRAPMDMGRYFRMITPAQLDFKPTFDAVGAPSVSFEQGLAETLSWLRQLNPTIFRVTTPARY